MVKKILLCSNTVWFLWNFNRNLLKTLIDRGYQVVLCAPYDNYVNKIILLGCEFININIDRRGTNPFTDAVLIGRFLLIIGKERPDVILTFTPKPNIYATLASGLYNTPVINNISGLGFIFIHNGYKAYVVRLLYKFAFYFSNIALFLNNDDMKEFINMNLVSPEKTELIPGTGVDTEWFSPGSHEKQKSTITFLLIARMLWDKGVQEFVDAATILNKIYSNLIFLLLGPIDPGNPAAISHETLECWNFEKNIIWLGGTDDVRGAINDADCVVLPSYREGLPRTLLEAASMAKPSIATDVPGCREAIKDGVTGFLCRPHDANDLAEKIEKMILLSHEERHAMGLAGREMMLSGYDEKVVIHRYITAIEKLWKSEPLN